MLGTLSSCQDGCIHTVDIIGGLNFMRLCKNMGSLYPLDIPDQRW